MSGPEHSVDQELVTTVDRALTDLTSRPQVAEAVRTRGWSDELWSAAQNGGWLSVMAPERLGGLELGLDTAGAVFGGFGRHLMPGPLVEHAVLAPLLLPHVTGQVREVLEAVISGHRMMAFADPEAGGQRGPDRPTLLNGALTGHVDLVRFADRADVLLVAADDDAGRPTLVLVGADAAGVRRTVRPSFDSLAQYARVDFDHAAAQPVLAQIPAASRHLDRVRGAIRLVIGCELAGLARRMLDDSVAYARLRHQFGAPIGSFQAVQHMLADMAADTVVLEAFCDESARAATSAAAAVAPSGIAAKALAAAIARRVGEGALQVHGGIGFTAEHHLHRWFHHALALQGWYGDDAELAVSMGRAVLDEGSRL